MDDQKRRFDALATETNRQFAHAVIYGGMSRTEASAFCVFIMHEKLTQGEPADNLELYLSDR